jgi:hypothetical protein
MHGKTAAVAARHILVSCAAGRNAPYLERPTVARVRFGRIVPIAPTFDAIHGNFS